VHQQNGLPGLNGQAIFERRTALAARVIVCWRSLAKILRGLGLKDFLAARTAEVEGCSLVFSRERAVLGRQVSPADRIFEGIRHGCSFAPDSPTVGKLEEAPCGAFG